MSLKSCDGADDLCRTAIAVPKLEPVYIPFFTAQTWRTKTVRYRPTWQPLVVQLL